MNEFENKNDIEEIVVTAVKTNRNKAICALEYVELDEIIMRIGDHLFDYQTIFNIVKGVTEVDTNVLRNVDYLNEPNKQNSLDEATKSLETVIQYFNGSESSTMEDI